MLAFPSVYFNRKQFSVIVNIAIVEIVITSISFYCTKKRAREQSNELTPIQDSRKSRYLGFTFTGSVVARISSSTITYVISNKTNTRCSILARFRGHHYHCRFRCRYYYYYHYPCLYVTVLTAITIIVAISIAKVITITNIDLLDFYRKC